jgi:hypothetical protein
LALEANEAMKPNRVCISACPIAEKLPKALIGFQNLPNESAIVEKRRPCSASGSGQMPIRKQVRKRKKKSQRARGSGGSRVRGLLFSQERIVEEHHHPTLKPIL